MHDNTTQLKSRERFPLEALALAHYTDALCCLVAITLPVILQGAFGIWSNQPLNLGGDHAFFLSDFKQMIMGQGFWSSQITGYPYGQSVVYFPTFEPLLRLLMWVIAQTGVSVFTAEKLFYVACIGFMGGACFICLRALSTCPMLAAIGAIAFTLTPYFHMRALNHDMLSIYIAAAFGPCFAIAIARLNTAEEFRKLAVSPLFIIGMIVIATCGIYYAMFSLLLMGVATLTLAPRANSVQPLVIFSGLSALVFVMLFVGALGPNILFFLSGAPHRAPVEQFWHGLSISDSMYSFDWIPRVHKHIQNYNMTRPTTLLGEGHYEWPGAVLTLTVLSCPLIALWGINTTSENQRIRDIAITATLVCFVLIFAGRGGLGYLVNEFITPALRAQARIMPMLVFMAIFIVLTATEYAWHTGALPKRAAAACVIAAMLISCWDARGVLMAYQMPNASDPAYQFVIQSFKYVEAAKDKAGLQAILQLPIVSWPETPYVNGFDFAPMRYGFLFDRRDSTTKWSYGVSERQVGFATLAHDFKPGFEQSNLVHRARRLGFDGILIEKQPYAASDLQTILAGIEGSLPASCKLYDDNARTLFDIGSKGCQKKD